jgi:hypothetical protein
MRKRLDPWKGKHLSSGGRLILTNSCLSSLPMYCMGFYLLPEEFHYKMNSIRSNFFWQGAEKKKCYHMAKWEMVTRPKDQGGLGILDSRLMNECLLVKWIWKIAQGSNDTWFKLIKGKYMTKGNFFLSSDRDASQFWKGLHKVKHLFKWGAIYKVRDEEGTLFWKDTWWGDVPLKLVYPRFFDICMDKDARVVDYYEDGEWNIDLKRPLTIVDLQVWDELVTKLVDQELTHGRDEVIWVLDKSKTFTTQFMYRFMTDGGIRKDIYINIWKSKVPLRIKVFCGNYVTEKFRQTWCLKKGWKGSDRCALCQKQETVDHIFFQCSLAYFVWSCLRQVFGRNNIPSSVEEMFCCRIEVKPKRTSLFRLFLLAGMVWALWRNRNKMVFEREFPCSPFVLLRDTVSFLQKWKVLLSEDEQIMLEKKVEEVQSWIFSFKSIDGRGSDIVVI